VCISPSIVSSWNALRARGSGFLIASYKKGSKTDVEVAREAEAGELNELHKALADYETMKHVTLFQQGSKVRGLHLPPFRLLVFSCYTQFFPSHLSALAARPPPSRCSAFNFTVCC
jgi:hypothetical protein